MADIFISYAREDEDKIRDLACVFEKQGWTVFWDRRIPAGQTWHSYIGKALNDAKCVVVAWSSYSTTSRWIYEEADEGQRRGVLIPLLLEPVQPPIGFRSIQAADLSNWHPGHPSLGLDQLIKDIGSVIGFPAKQAYQIPVEEPQKPPPQKVKKSPWAILSHQPSHRAMLIKLFTGVVIVSSALALFKITMPWLNGIAVNPSRASHSQKIIHAAPRSSSTSKVKISPEMLNSYKIDIYYYEGIEKDYSIALQIQHYLSREAPHAKIILAPRPIKFFSTIGVPTSYEVRYLYDSESIAANTLVNMLKSFNPKLDFTTIQATVPSERRQGILSIILCSQQQLNLLQYKVGLQTLGIPHDKFKQLYERILSHGYIEDDSISNAWQDNQSWLSRKSTVLYYDDANIERARELSILMKSLTGDTFQIARGSGFGVSPEEYATCFIVHYIKH